VGGASIDVLGFRQDAAILNGLNYTPHPVFQSYAAYTPGLQRLNTAFSILSMLRNMFCGSPQPSMPAFPLWTMALCF